MFVTRVCHKIFYQLPPVKFYAKKPENSYAIFWYCFYVYKSYTTTKKNGKHAILFYKTLKKLDRFYLVEIKPQTGRHHQIRVQLSEIGFRKLDRLYSKYMAPIWRS